MNDEKIVLLNKVLNDYLKKFNCSLIGLDTDFYCYPKEKEIAYGLTFIKNEDKYFNKLFKKFGIDFPCDEFILAFFHEIGHCMTHKYFTPKQKFHIKNIKYFVENGKLNTFKKLLYYHCLDEYRATRWASWYILNHKREVKRLWDKIQPLIIGFYIDNGLIAGR